MGVFDGSVQTNTRVRLDRDAFQPDMGTLVGSSWDEDILVHGSRNLMVDEDMEIFVGGTTMETYVGAVDRAMFDTITTTVMSDETRTVIGTSTITRTGTTTRTHVDNVVETNLSTRIGNTIGAFMNSIVGPESRTSMAIKNLLNGSGPTWIDVKQNSTTLVLAMNTSMGGMNNCFFIGNNEAYVNQVNMIGIDQALKGLEGSLKGSEDNIGFFGMKAKAVSNDTKAVAGNIGASCATGPGVGNAANGPFPGVGGAP